MAMAENESENNECSVVLENCACESSVDLDLNDLMSQVFENKLILGAIFGKFQGEERLRNLKKCRRVEKSTWKKVASEQIRLWNWDERNFLNLSTDTKLEKYLQTVSSSPDLPLFSCYSIERERDDYNIEDKRKRKCNQALLDNFFGSKNISQMIRSLSLSFTFESGEQLSSILQTQSSSLNELKIFLTRGTNPKQMLDPNVVSLMKDLQLEEREDFKLVNLNYLCLTMEYDEEDQLPLQLHLPGELFLRILLSKIPRNKSLKICLMHWENIGNMVSIFQHYEQLKNLKVLGISHLAKGELTSLADAGVQLQFLEVDPPPFYSSPTVNDLTDFDGKDRALELTQEVSTFIETQANNLKALSWGSAWNFRFPTATMPALKKLRLTIHRFFGYDDDEPYLSARQENWVQNSLPIFYADFFPKLEELELHNDSSRQTRCKNWFLSPQFPSTSLKKLKIDFNGMDANIMKSISDIFPLITSLEIDGFKNRDLLPNLEAERDFFSVLWNSEFASTLQEFIIELDMTYSTGRHEYEYDSLFGGISEVVIKEIAMSDDYANPNITNHIIPSGRGSILNFTNLKKLVIGLDTQNIHVDRGAFTDFSMFCLFGKLDKLEELRLTDGIYNFPTAESYAWEKFWGAQEQRSGSDVRILSAEERIDEIFQTGFKKSVKEENVQIIKESELPDARDSIRMMVARYEYDKENDSDSDSNPDWDRHWYRRSGFDEIDPFSFQLGFEEN